MLQSLTLRPNIFVQIAVWYTLLATLLASGWQLHAKLYPDSPSTVTVGQATRLAPAHYVHGSQPVHLTIAAQSVDLAVLPGNFNAVTGQWQITGLNAHYATETVAPNNWRGTTVIYGHNNRHVLGPAKSLLPGDQAVLTTAAGERFTYTFSGYQVVDPADTDILRIRTGHPTLVLITCDDIWNEHRRLMYFNYIGVTP